MKKFETHPPVDIVVAALLEKNKPKPVGEVLKTSGLPVRKGRVRKNGNTSRGN
jgi:hypothetical protein